MTIKRISERSLFFLILFTLACAWGMGCKTSDHSIENDYLIRCGTSEITVGDYYKALEIAKTAYSHSTLMNKDSLRKIQLRLLSQMAEELIIKRISEEKQITVSDEELDAAVNDIKKDYPDDEVFEEMLLENAIPFDLWKERLRKQMLMKKVLAAEVDSDVAITPEMMEAYYKSNASDIEADLEEGTEATYEKLISRMRSEKRQSAYQDWIEKKKADYSIEVNEKIWEKIVGS